LLEREQNGLDGQGEIVAGERLGVLRDGGFHGTILPPPDPDRRGRGLRSSVCMDPARLPIAGQVQERCGLSALLKRARFPADSGADSLSPGVPCTFAERGVMGSPTVLLADDDAPITCVVAQKLRSAGFTVVTAGDGAEAYDLACKICPALIVTDLQMPQLSGLELAQKLKQTPQTASTPVIMLTARGYILEPGMTART